MDELTQELRAAEWTKSSRSGSNGGNCVEVASLSAGRRGVRDSKNPTGPVLVIKADEWTTFVEGIRGGALH